MGHREIVYTDSPDRLRANGVISAENPLRTAVEQGRFAEIKEDEKDSDEEVTKVTEK